MSTIEYGSIQLKSPRMIQIMESIGSLTISELLFVIGEKGTGKTFFAKHLQTNVFKSSDVVIVDSYDSSISKGIITLTPQRWAEIESIVARPYKVIQMPRLADRKADLPALADFFLQVLSLMHNKPKAKLTEKSLEKILQYGWPGQFHEFEAVLEEAYLQADGGTIEPQFLQMGPVSSDVEIPAGMRLEDLERKYILQTLYFVHQNRTKAAEILGISIRTLRNKINQYRIEGFL